MEPREPAKPKRVSGFTLIELIATTVIIAIVASFVVPKYQDLRHAARSALVKSLMGQIAGNMSSSIALWHIQNATPLVTGGLSIPVNDTGFDAWNNPVPRGSPTGNAMYVLVGCGDSPPAPDTVATCPGLPGYRFIVWGGVEFTIWPTDVHQPIDPSVPNCYVDYWPAYNHDPAWTAPAYVPANASVVDGLEFAIGGC